MAGPFMAPPKVSFEIIVLQPAEELNQKAPDTRAYGLCASTSPDDQPLYRSRAVIGPSASMTIRVSAGLQLQCGERRRVDWPAKRPGAGEQRGEQRGMTRR